jgi:hypothetical protein
MLRGYTSRLAGLPRHLHELKRRNFSLMAMTVPKALQARRPVRDVPPPRDGTDSLPTLSFRTFFTASRVASAYKTPPPCDVATTATGVLPFASTPCLVAS